jgi:hypothetical protein
MPAIVSSRDESRVRLEATFARRLPDTAAPQRRIERASRIPQAAAIHPLLQRFRGGHPNIESL